MIFCKWFRTIYYRVSAITKEAVSCWEMIAIEEESDACHGTPWMPLIRLSKADHQSVWFMKLIPLK